jgi:hypothetical protein
LHRAEYSTQRAPHSMYCCRMQRATYSMQHPKCNV